MKIGIIGGSGFIGRHLYCELKNTGLHNTKVFDVVRHSQVNEQDFYYLDVLDLDLPDDFFREFDIIFFKVGLMGPALSFENAPRYYDINLKSVLYIVGKCIKSNVGQFVFDSTESVFGTGDNTPFKEYQQPNPCSVYGATKAICEHYLRYLATHNNINIGILRYPRIISTTQENIFKAMFNKVKSGEKITVSAGGKKKFDLVHIDDVIKWNLWFVDHSGSFTLHVTSGLEVSLEEIIHRMSEMINNGKKYRNLFKSDDHSWNDRLLPDACRLDNEYSYGITGLRNEFVSLEHFIKYFMEKSRSE